MDTWIFSFQKLIMGNILYTNVCRRFCTTRCFRNTATILILLQRVKDFKLTLKVSV